MEYQAFPSPGQSFKWLINKFQQLICALILTWYKNFPDRYEAHCSDFCPSGNLSSNFCSFPWRYERISSSWSPCKCFLHSFGTVTITRLLEELGIFPRIEARYFHCLKSSSKLLVATTRISWSMDGIWLVLPLFTHRLSCTEILTLNCTWQESFPLPHFFAMFFQSFLDFRMSI